jgi:hypothetical protein
VGTLAEFPCGNRSFKDPGVLPHLSSETTRTLKLWVGLAGRPYARPGGAEHPEPVSNRINRFGNYVVNPDRFPEPLEQHLGFSIAGTKLAALVFYFLGFAACFAATNALPFCFVAAAFACFCAACFCVDFGDLSPIRLNYHPWFGRREP